MLTCISNGIWLVEMPLPMEMRFRPGKIRLKPFIYLAIAPAIMVSILKKKTFSSQPILIWSEPAPGITVTAGM
jgi:hypothetical protein